MARGDKEKEEKGYVASLRTALSAAEDSIVRKLPEPYQNVTVAEVISYLTNRQNIKPDEASIAKSVRDVMDEQYTIEVNGRPAEASYNVSELFVTKKHKGVSYNSLEIEVADVQRGGLTFLLG